MLQCCGIYSLNKPKFNHVSSLWPLSRNLLSERTLIFPWKSRKVKFCFFSQYATEKIFKRLQHRLVPIVFGHRNYMYGNVPNGSVIFVEDFCSVKDLTDYLIYLDGNTTAYARYFEWRLDFQVSNAKSKDIKIKIFSNNKLLKNILSNHLLEGCNIAFLRKKLR